MMITMMTMISIMNNAITSDMKKDATITLI